MGRPRIYASDAERQRAFRARKRKHPPDKNLLSAGVLRAPPEERAQILSTLTPFDSEAWMRHVAPATPEEMSALEEFLREREVSRWQSLEREQSRLVAPGH
jgi:hypothetical protein